MSNPRCSTSPVPPTAALFDSGSRWHTRMSMIESLQGISDQRWSDFEHVYRPLLLFWIRKKGVPLNAMEDVLQESLISIMQGINKYEHGGRRSFRGWLRTIVQRRAIDFFRSLPPEIRGMQERLNDAAFPARTKHDENGETVAANEVLSRAVEVVRSRTKELTWRMFWLSTVDNRSTVEISHELGVSTAAVRVARQRVKNRIKALMLARDVTSK